MLVLACSLYLSVVLIWLQLCGRHGYIFELITLDSVRAAPCTAAYSNTGLQGIMHRVSFSIIKIK